MNMNSILGPAHASKELGRGDAIIKVDGQKVSPENCEELLTGGDKPGSIAILTIIKAETIAAFSSTSMGDLLSNDKYSVDVTLRRVPTKQMQDKVSGVQFNVFPFV
jgi:C-terminal processing protease CtpA/Prc